MEATKATETSTVHFAEVDTHRTAMQRSLRLLVLATSSSYSCAWEVARVPSRHAHGVARRSALSMSATTAAPVDSAADELVTAISGDGSISAKAIVTTALVAETSRLQGLGGLAAAALGRALTCTLMIADGLEEDETFQVNFQGDGPLRGVLALANGKLEARGYVGNPAVTLPPNAKGKFDVGQGVGKGSLQVVRTKNLPGEVRKRTVRKRAQKGST